MASFVPKPLTVGERILRAKEHFGGREFSRKDYLGIFKTISTATASRDLKRGIEDGVLVKQGDKALATYYFGEAGG